LGDGTTINKSSPVQIGSSSWTSVTAGESHSAAIRTDGALFTWGGNTSGQLGDGTTINKSSPVQIGSSSWTMVTAGAEGTQQAGLTADGYLFQWGNDTGILGAGP
jgi:alpha-tubulin suppressor-like RCC1 family protein